MIHQNHHMPFNSNSEEHHKLNFILQSVISLVLYNLGEDNDTEKKIECVAWRLYYSYL